MFSGKTGKTMGKQKAFDLGVYTLSLTTTNLLTN
jgi:hypothetical protein